MVRKNAFLYAGLILTSLAVIVCRRPDVLLHPQFWAEDGHYWYGQAYNYGISQTFFKPENGYLQTISRLIASVALLLPLKYVPHFFNFSAIIIQLLPIAVLWSPRFRHVVPSKIARLVLMLIYLLLPNSSEEHANITNAHWHLALAALMLIISGIKDQSRWQSLLESSFFLLAGLSGPFSLFLFPVALIYWFYKRYRSSLAQVFVLGASALCQLVFLAAGMKTTRVETILGISLRNFIKIMGGQIFGSGIFGHQFISWSDYYPIIPGIACVVGFSLMICVFVLGKLELKIFLLFSLMVFASSLIAPQISLTEPQWVALTRENIGIRYYFFPILAWLIVLAWCTAYKNIFLKITGGVLLAAAIIGFISDFRYNPYVYYDFTRQAAQFGNLQKGESFVFPINPTGWTMILVKH